MKTQIIGLGNCATSSSLHYLWCYRTDYRLCLPFLCYRSSHFRVLLFTHTLLINNLYSKILHVRTSELSSFRGSITDFSFNKFNKLSIEVFARNTSIPLAVM